MKLPGLIDLSFILILASRSKGQRWNISVESHINARVNSDVTIKCSFTIASKFDTDDPKVYWKKNVRSTLDIKDKNDRNAFVYHPNATFVLEQYRGKTELIGDIKKGDCTLKIRNVMHSDEDIYVRVIAKDSFSFKRNFITINVTNNDGTRRIGPVTSKPGRRPVTSKPDNAHSESPTFELTTVDMADTPLTTTTTTTYIGIFVPVAALLIIAVTGIVFWRKRRSKAVAREGSGYYANFRRASSNQDNREASCKKQDTKKLPETKNIDEPVYINFEVPPGQVHQSNDHADNVYANVDYLKQ